MAKAPETKYRIGEFVIYRESGIYRITDIRAMRFHSDKESLYYALDSLNDPKTSVFVPVKTDPVRPTLRRLAQKAQVRDLIKRKKALTIDWIEDTRERAASYGEAVKSSDRETIYRIYRALSAYKKRVEAENKKSYASDEKVLDTARRLVAEEIAFVLEIEKNEALNLL